MSQSLAALLKLIDTRKALLDARRPLPPATLASLHDKLALEWTYNSNAIEGNTLTLRETQVVLEGITVGGKSLREHLEAINHQEAIGAVESLIQSGKQMTEWDVRGIHQIVLKGIAPEYAGRYRTENVAIVGASHTPPAAVQVPERMTELMRWLNSTPSGGLHPVARAAEFHTRFVEIHPFVDGNGRTGRLLMNAVLMQDGYPPAVIRAENRPAYYDALDRACVTRDYGDITRLVAQETIRSLDSYLEVIEGRQPGREPEQTQRRVKRPGRTGVER
ncbi:MULTISPECIES: Fic family protein [Thiomonas]|jgi:Fic family protein|uniref:Fic family protein n=1 Tax=Thiomonas arsenitoxydans (strain DSM 22701 / CIP 110005 / 3As) TaxID=426114 RepID=A0A8I1MVR5_THIA3|nr:MULTISPECIES: Fic family protein [Thiomonas]CQR44828.1 Filamentation induced by cAMP protein Fic [Thiomonas sp. CB3]MBN8744660.1 Fic family protein [Thiomonas arsenitoxydans]ODU94744.1 MAG: cell filamentation protein Fic [Thiomonas sp. SCN 64-16]CDW92600.1 Filamentation induced by cAMP protein Fic [Thiomonas sp. CB2]SCC91873.1 Filamentation induced by cAMP protein Fic [Thiomonas sp. X19]